MPAFDDFVNPNGFPRRRHQPAVPPPQPQVLINQLYVVMPPHQIVPAQPAPQPLDEAERERKNAARAKFVDEYVRDRTELINPAWSAAMHKASRERIIDHLQNVKVTYERASGRVSAVKISGQNPYNNMKRHLAKDSDVDPEIAETVRLMCTDQQYTPDMAERIIHAGLDPSKVFLPLANAESRKLSSTTAAAVKKVRREFKVDEDTADDVRRAVVTYNELGGPDGDNPDFMLCYARTGDILRGNDACMERLDRLIGHASEERQNNHGIIDGVNATLRDTDGVLSQGRQVLAHCDSLADKADRALEAAQEATDAGKDVAGEIRTVHKLVGNLSTAFDAKVDALSKKVDSLNLAGDLDRLPALIDSAANTQGAVTNLHADFSQKHVPFMNQLQADFAALRQTVDAQGRLLQQLLAGGAAVSAAPVSTPAHAPVLSTPAHMPVSTSTPVPQQQQQQQQPSTPTAAPAGFQSMLASWTHQHGSPSPSSAGFQSTAAASVAGSPHHPHLSAAYGGPQAAPPHPAHTPGAQQHQQHGGQGQHQPFIFGGGGAAGTPIAGTRQFQQHGGGGLQNPHTPAPVDSHGSNMWSTGPPPPPHGGQQYQHGHHQGQPQQQQQQSPRGVYPNGGGAPFLHYPQPR